ncbi:D-aminoacyl-tRNA deacylase [Planctomycetales bacterium 10988]|nr:D-aminoacyl-tRNA deacylase [Planctomycetales bacterium 10988]
MKVCIQRVSQAEVKVEGEIVGKIGQGMLILLGVAAEDTEEDLNWLVKKVLTLRMFEDDAGKMNLDLKAVGGEVLVVSQFTLYGDCRKGRRPSFTGAAPPEKAEAFYLKFCEAIAMEEIKVEQGKFRHHMDVSLTNDGPVTFIIESPER